MRRRKILIIDDEVEFTTVVKINLEETGHYQVVVENDPLCAVETIENAQPDLILLDVIMPHKEGPDIIVELRNNENLKNIPVVFLTATVRKEEVDEHDGCIAGHTFLAKPTTIQELIMCIEKKLSQTSSNH